MLEKHELSDPLNLKLNLVLSDSTCNKIFRQELQCAENVLENILQSPQATTLKSAKTRTRTWSTLPPSFSCQSRASRSLPKDSCSTPLTWREKETLYFQLDDIWRTKERKSLMDNLINIADSWGPSLAFLAVLQIESDLEKENPSTISDDYNQRFNNALQMC